MLCCREMAWPQAEQRDGWLVFARIVEPTLVDAFWPAGVVGSTPFAGSFAK